MTKVGAAEHEDGSLSAAQPPEQLRAQVEADLRGLGVERVEVVNLRRLGRPRAYERRAASSSTSRPSLTR